MDRGIRGRGIVASLCVALWGSQALAGYREDSLLEYLEKMRSGELERREARLEDLHATFVNPDGQHDRKLVSLALGVHYLERSPRLALQYLSSAEVACRENDPLLGIVRYYLAQVRLKSGAYQESMKLAAGLIEKSYGAFWGKFFYSVLIEAAYAAGDYERVVSTFEEYTKNYSFSRRQETLAHYAAVAFEKRGDMTRAAELLEELARGYPTTEESRWAFLRLQELACETTKTGRAVYHFSTRLLLHLSRNAILGTGLKEFIVAHADRPLIQEDGSLRLLMPAEKAEFFFKARFYHEALAVSKDLYVAERDQPDSKLLPEVIFGLGRIHLRLWEPMLASRYFSLFLSEYPRHPNAVRARESLGDALRNAGHPLAAAQSYESAAGQRDSRLLRWHHFWSLYRAKKLEEALALLEQAYVQPRDGDDELTVSYWHARILERLGRKAEADLKYTAILTDRAESYYANLIAAVRPDLIAGQKRADLAKTSEPRRGFALAAKLLDPPPTASDLSEGLAAHPHLKVVDDLVRVGLKDAAKVELAGLKWTTFAQEQAFATVSRVALSLDDYNPTRRIRYSTFSALKSLPESWWDYVNHQIEHADEWKIYYPLAFDKAVSSVVSRIRLSPFLILSVMRTESFYNKDARSGVGAQGLMQLMPYTAMKIATLVKDQNFHVLDLTNPEVNIGYGTYYLDKLLRYYGDNPFLAVAAYNGGPVAVNQWLGSCKDCASDEFVESIQYRETRRYVREVMRNYAQYSRIYTGKQALSELPPMPSELPDGEEIF